jgi:hypothetical protein
VLSRRNLAGLSPRSLLNPLSFMRLQPLCSCFSTHAPLFSMVCGLFFENTRVGCTQQKPSSRISNLPTRRPRTVCKPVTLRAAGIDLHVPRFHTVTNPFFRKSFIFTSICVAGGAASSPTRSGGVSHFGARPTHSQRRDPHTPLASGSGTTQTGTSPEVRRVRRLRHSWRWAFSARMLVIWD